MRFASVWQPDERCAQLCAVSHQGELHAIGPDDGQMPEVSALIAHGAADGLAAAAQPLLAAEPLGRLDQLSSAEPHRDSPHLLAPVRPAEVWAAGVTYELSRDARMHESAEADVYQRVYEADRPELFLKATAPRVLGPNALLGIRGDSGWHVPEPELGLVLGADGAILGYTLGNDLSSRDIEGENPLYLPQAKIFAGSCALGPLVISADQVEDAYALTIRMSIDRKGATVFEGEIQTSSLHVTFDTLVEHLRRDNWLAPGTVLLTGTGLVPPDELTLEPDDTVEITCQPIGSLRNRIAAARDLAPPPGWA